MAGSLAGIGKALDEMSWEWMNNTHPQLAAALERAVRQGAEPMEVRRLVMEQTARVELALRCQQAARWLCEGRG